MDSLLSYPSVTRSLGILQKQLDRRDPRRVAIPLVGHQVDVLQQTTGKYDDQYHKMPIFWRPKQ